MSNISFANPWLLFLLIPFLAMVLVPFFITVKRDNANFHNITSAVLHVIICICITLVISGMTFNTAITQTNVFVLADVSYSATHNLDEVQRSVQEVSNKLPKNSKMGVICFARDYKLVSDLGEGVPDIRSSEKVEELDKSATDIASALRYAGNLFDDDVIKRIIVITDGAETVTTSNIIRVVNNLHENGVYVDAVYIDDNINPATREIQIDGIEVTPSTFINKEEQVSVLVRANCGVNDDNEVISKTEGYVSLYNGGERIGDEKAAIFYNGLTVVNIALPTDTAGTFTYDVKVRTANANNDYLADNNSYTFSQTVSSDKKVLFIGATQADCLAGQRIYGQDGVTYVNKIEDLSKNYISVEQLCVFDEIALSNFDVRTVPAAKTFLTSLSTLVDRYGKTLTTYGNTFVQDNVDGSNDILNQYAGLLPVNIGNVNQNKRLVTILIDISRSINSAGRMDVAKRAAISLLNVLTPNDKVMVLGFAGRVETILAPTNLTAITAIVDAINKIEPQNNTNFDNALTQTYGLMAKEEFIYKQLFIITDGASTVGNTQTALNTAYQMSENGIDISALGIYITNQSDNAFLDSIVHNPYVQSKDVFYQNIEHESQIDVTLREIMDDLQEVVIFGESYEVKVKTENEAVEGLSSFGSVHGFYYNSAKSTATVVLTAKYERDRRNSFDVPLYAFWSSGNGKVVSFTSDITSGANGNWISDWTVGSDGDKFLHNIADATLPEQRINSPFLINLINDGSVLTVNVYSPLVSNAKADFKVTLYSPDERITEKTLTFNASNYVAVFDIDAIGLYNVHVEYAYGDIRYEADANFTIAYYAEYDAFATYSRSSLYRLITEYGSILNLAETDRLENSHSAYSSYVFDFTLPLMILCALLLLADIIIRQLRWKDVTSFFGGLFRRRK